MEDKVRQVLAQIINPATGATLSTEGRFQSIVVDGSKVSIVYNRDGISPQEKRSIENSIHQLLNGWFKPEEITVETVSKDSRDVIGATPLPVQEKPKDVAQIKTGHGTMGNKKPVPGIGKLIAVGSGKGGVGKSTFTVNLACTLSRMGKKVGIIDADIYGPSVPMLLNKRFDKPFSNSEKKIIPLEAFGVKFISFGLFINENDPVIWRGPMLGGVLNQFLFDVDWAGLDYLLIDLPPGTGDIQLSMIQNTIVDGAIIISTPQDVALLDATKGLEMFKKLNLPVVGMVENMSSVICNNCSTEHFIFGHGGVEKQVQKLEVPFLGSIPIELELRSSSDEGFPYMAHVEWDNRAVSKAYREIAKNVDQYFHQPEKKSPGILAKLFGKET